ncbi:MULTISPECIES: STAS domain-containing protein [unclassified Agarivorans]|uniref:STAS domain-containing protein n=1 Tax=unclassified Agarivorans TaxID=2636026 RepID=UPI0010D8DF81|nr:MULTISPECIES: STAS domain-containing protein [unclassified Agarivorans]MDO6688119.1 STAS domain-containing protein [Agarivorans sp. 3_MG-2023]MDO6717751.1 STAS domain-containing protein [Agarivorans sp. 2_MG-2023]MDO6766177.1 STAS domain-containing protein [Agarivorans sp. 1_MG-2023]GDY27858.1 STAS domain-containing protein [Agarivorans sp. Toyoura001]
MSISSQLNQDLGQLIICITGRFDYSLHRDFRACYENISVEGVQLILDLSAADYMDSSALGMMLLLKEHAEKSQALALTIRKPSPAILKILEIANFDKLLKIEN